MINFFKKKKKEPFPEKDIEIFCPHCETKTRLIYLDHYEVDQKNPVDVASLNNDDDLVYPKMTKAMYEGMKNISSDNTTRFFAMIAKLESHREGLSKENCDQSNKMYKVFNYIFINHENQTAGLTFRLVEEILTENS